MAILSFTNGRQVEAVIQAEGQEVASLLDELKLGPASAVLLICGGTDTLDPTVARRLDQLFERGVCRIAAEVEALCVDGGTDAGIIQLFGRACARSKRSAPLLGVAPAIKIRHDELENSRADGIPLEPHHTHFLLSTGQEWGDETTAMFEAVSLLAKDQPVVQVIAAGGVVTLKEVLEAARRGWSTILIEGSGGAADQLVKQRATPPTLVEDPIAAEIFTEGDIHVLSASASPEALAGCIRIALGREASAPLIRRKAVGNAILADAWRRFAALDAAAIQQQAWFVKLQFMILGLGVVGTLLVILKQWWLPDVAEGQADPQPLLRSLLFAIILLVPILLATLVAGVNRFKQGNKWLLLRAAAEAVKREIFRYRAGAGDYGARRMRDGLLAQRIEDVTRRLARTEANTAAIKPYQGPIPPRMYGAAENDDGLSPLTPEGYVRIRLADQLAFYRSKAVRIEHQMTTLQWLILGIGGAGTFLAALGHELWIAMTTAVVGALTTFLGYKQLDSTLIAYNQAATDLESVQAWWLALSPEERVEPSTFDKLVQHVEQVLETELAGWVQKMNDALVDLRKQQAPKEPDTEEEPAGRSSEGKASGSDMQEARDGGDAPRTTAATIAEAGPNVVPIEAGRPVVDPPDPTKQLLSN